MRISVEPVAILEDIGFALAIRVGRRSFQLRIRVLPVQFLEILGDVLEHAPIFLHLC